MAIPTPKKVKIGPKTIDCIFIDYAQNSSSYRFLVYKSEIHDINKNTIMDQGMRRSLNIFFHVSSTRGQVRLSESMRL